MPHSPGQALDEPVRVASGGQFLIFVPIWATGVGFAKLSGFSSAVESQEYSYNGMMGNIYSKQFGRTKPPMLVLERALDQAGFAQMFAWHTLARQNSPTAKMPAAFEIMAADREVMLACALENAWCSKLELDAVQAGGGNVITMRATIECDAVVPA